MSSSSSTPPDGWVEELRLAESEAKKNPQSAAARLRVSKALCKLRMWKKCRKVSNLSNLGLSLENVSATERAQFNICLGLAEKELSEKSFVDEKDYKEGIRPKLASGEANPEYYLLYTGSPCFTNLNILQYAAFRGDVRLLEDVVAFGAAIDFPVLDFHYEEVPPFPAPAGSNALVLCCANLASYNGTNFPEHLVNSSIRMQNKRQLECAVRLVKLGADLGKKLEGIPRHKHPRSELQCIEQGYHEFGLVGKTVKELAAISRRQPLIDAIAQMESEDRAIELAQCRCGSRLPWKQCHAGFRTGESPHYIKTSEGKLCWRVSPLAVCPCKNTQKPHFKCCWNTTIPCYQNDESGSLQRNRKMPVDDELVSLMEKLKAHANAEGEDLMFPARDAQGRSLGRPMTNEEIGAMQAKNIRSRGQAGLRELAETHGPKCRVGEWDPEVFAGCVERITNSFMWVDAHWQLDESELLVRAKDWNEALENYCNDKGLSGEEREDVVKLHTASPFAPCGNPSCNNVETKVKEFQKCSRCKSIGYCSRDPCQKEDWKRHRKSCIPK